jgi:hypothetical protein
MLENPASCFAFRYGASLNMTNYESKIAGAFAPPAI